MWDHVCTVRDPERGGRDHVRTLCHLESAIRALEHRVRDASRALGPGVDGQRGPWSTRGVGTRVHGYLVCALVLGAVVVPCTWPMHRDSFPLSNYPMFSRPLPEAAFSMEYALGVEADGTRHHLSPEIVGSSEVLQARAMLASAVRRGKDATQRICLEIAGRVRSADDLERVVEVRIVTGKHDAVDYLTGADRVGEERVHGRCTVDGASRGVAPPPADRRKGR